MKKLTVKEFATKLRKKYPGELDNLDDVTLIYRWLKKYPKDSEYLDKTDALNSGFTFTKDNVVNWVKGKTEKIKDKITPQPTDTTKTTDSTSDSTKTTTQQPIITPKPTQTQPVDLSVFNCIKNSNTKGKNLQQTKDNPEAYSFFNTDGSEFTFWANGDFTYYDGDTTANGKWKCKGGNNFEANVDWKGTTHYYRSETNEWALTQNAKKTVYENTIKKIVSKNLKSLTK
jgi:hypothetical protein